MAYVLTREGDVVPLESDKILFRKYFDDPDDIERVIVTMLKDNPHPHIVDIYDVTDEYYDMELVKTGLRRPAADDQPCMRLLKDHLHDLGIVYLDWKIDNFGRDADGTLKMFDFNGAALFEMKGSCCWAKSEWVRKPSFSGYLVRMAQEAGKKTPIECDEWIFETQFISPPR